MKHILLVCVLMFAPYMLAAQSFTVAVAPGSQVVPIGQTATYSVVITPLNGYKATVFLSVQSSPAFYGSVVLSVNSPNTPYDNITLKITPSILDTGTKTFTINAENGSVHSSATCTVTIPKNAQWTTIQLPSYVWSWYRPFYVYLKKHLNGSICFASYQSPNLGGKVIVINYFSNQKWNYNAYTLPIFAPQDNNLVLFQNDSSGNYWFRHQRDIIRYDPNFITLYNSTNSQLPDIIYSMDCDRKGNLSCITMDNSGKKYVSTLDGSSWKSVRFTFQEDVPYVVIGKSCIDMLNRVWIPTVGGGIIRVSDTVQETIRKKNNPALWCDSIVQIECDKDGGIWCMYSGHSGESLEFAMLYYDGNTWKNIKSPTTSRLLTFFIDDNKHIWLSSDEGLHYYDGTVWTTYNASNSPLPKGTWMMAQDKNKNIWMVIDNLFYVFNPNGLVDMPLAPSGVAEQAAPSNDISISPNPSTHTITITGANSSIAPVKILNSLGIEVAIGRESVAANDAQVIDISTLASGVYFAQCRTASGVVTKPFVVAR